MHALEAPLLKLTLVAVGALAAAAFVPHQRAHPAMHRLVLHAPAQPNALYLSAWMDGDVSLEIDPHDLKVMQFETEADVSDGCHWIGVETLIPNGDHYDYTYDDRPLSCHPNPEPTIPTPRSGTVTIE